jgi:hypothetical protein
MRYYLDVAAEQGEQTAKPRRGRPRKWPSEVARREHEAAKRRLRNKTRLTSEAFHDVVRLTALADDLQRTLDGVQKEVEQLRARAGALERCLAEGSWQDRPSPWASTETPVSTPPPRMNRQQRREAERAQRRVEAQERRSEPSL